jgi:hypothetical protein
VITEVVEISEVKRSDKNTATSFLFLFCGKKEKCFLNRVNQLFYDIEYTE